MKKSMTILLGAIAGLVTVGGVMAAQPPTFGTRIDACIRQNESNARFQDRGNRAGLGRLRLYRWCFWETYQEDHAARRYNQWPSFGSSSSMVSSSASSVSSSQSSSSSSSTGSSVSSSSMSSGTGMILMSVSLKNNAYVPARLTVKLGTKVTWKNDEDSNTPHTVTRNQGQQGPLSGILTKSETYSYTFTATGSYAYHCAFHPTMTGSVLVTQ